jgi:cell division protein FtsW (lipid II flippase)
MRSDQGSSVSCSLGERSTEAVISGVVLVFLAAGFLAQVSIHAASGLASIYQVGLTLPGVSQGGGSLLAWILAIAYASRRVLMTPDAEADLGPPKEGQDVT